MLLFLSWFNLVETLFTNYRLTKLNDITILLNDLFMSQGLPGTFSKERGEYWAVAPIII